MSSWAEAGKGVYLKENATGAVACVGIFDPVKPGTQQKMVPLTEGFLHLGVPALQRAEKCDATWVCLDEIGYLETNCPIYQQAIRDLMEHKHLAAVVRKGEDPFLRELCSRGDVFCVDLDSPFGNTGCVIMASGLGTRFGENKLLADFRGQPLICRILNGTRGIFTQRVVVTRHEAVAALCRGMGIRTVLHQMPHRSDTVRLGLEAIGEVETCMFCTADQPLLRQETVASLALSAATGNAFIWRTQWKDIPGSPVVFPEWAFLELKNLPQGSGGSAVIRRYPNRVRCMQVSDPMELRDVDTPEDLRVLQNG